MAGRMDQKVAVITGAGAGMGRSFALRLAEEGAKVAVVDLAVDEAEETVRLVNESGGTARAYEADVTDLESLEAAVESIVNDFGSITTLVNNAGVLDGYAMLAETDEELWDKVMSVDLKGPFLASQACLPHLQASGNATIINIASVAALRPGGGGITYSTAKTGVLGLTRMIQHACGPEIRCNAILPGIVQTEMVEEAMNDPEA